MYALQNGRKYQATNDDYLMPADQRETIRLNSQHQAFKVRQYGKNYLAPIHKVLRGPEVTKRVLDIGTGTGIWAVEMAEEFPEADIIAGLSYGLVGAADYQGIDLAVPHGYLQVPSNCSFVLGDVSLGLPYPDEHFDVVHGRLLMSGIRDWKALVDEMARVLKPGGLMVFVECIGRRRLASGKEADQRELAPGFFRLTDMIGLSLQLRGLDPYCGSSTIPSLLHTQNQLCERNTAYMPLPMWPWSNDPTLQKTGELMMVDAVELPGACKRQVMSVCPVTEEDYDEMVDAWKVDVQKPGVTCIFPVWHHWATKRSSEEDEQ